MSASTDGIPPLFCSFNPFLWEADDTFDVSDQLQVAGFADEAMKDSLSQIIATDEEMINTDMMNTGEMQYFAEALNQWNMIDYSIVAGEQFCSNQILPDPSDEKMNFQEVGTCGDRELVQLVLAAGRMIGHGESDGAAFLVRECTKLSSPLGNPTQRLGHYVSHALHHRIQRNTLGTLSNAAKPVSDFASNIDGGFENNNDFCSNVAYYIRNLPHMRVLQFTSVQAIIDAVGNARTIHVIDLAVRTGSQWTVLMEFLAHRAATSPACSSLQMLKITAVGMNGEELWKCGKRLNEFARSLDIPFLYKIVEIQSMEEIKEGLFNVRSGEALAVYAPIVLRSLLYDPVLLVNVLSVIRKLRPRIMVTVEVEAKHNSPSFVKRLSEVLHKYSAVFDMLDVMFLNRNDVTRVKHEELIDGKQIRNMIVYEGKERTVRHVTVDVWRTFFQQAGFKGKSFSFRALYQANLLLRESAAGEYYTLVTDGQAVIVGWKGTRLFALSAWNGMK